MRGDLIQAASLCLYANAFLGGDEGVTFRGHSTLKHCVEVRFRSIEWRSDRARLVAANPDEWFRALREMRIEACRIDFRSNIRGVMTCRAGASILWKWAWDRTYPLGYKVVYQETASNPVAVLSDRPIDEVLAEADASLASIASLAVRLGVPSWADWFHHARSHLSEETPLSKCRYHQDAAPPGFLPLSHERLLATCIDAWCFGGMGSWNDLLLPRELIQEYRACTSRLSKVIDEGFDTAVNTSSDRSATPCSG